MMKKTAPVADSPETVDQDGIPLCPQCMRPVNPNNYYCPHCGGATGTFTPYLPFVNIPFNTSVYWRVIDRTLGRRLGLAVLALLIFLMLFANPELLLVVLPVALCILLWNKLRAN